MKAVSHLYSTLITTRQVRAKKVKMMMMKPTIITQFAVTSKNAKSQ